MPDLADEPLVRDSRTARPAASRFARRISEYLREQIRIETFWS